MENQTPNATENASLLGVTKPDYNNTEVGKWKPQEGFAQYAFMDDRLETRKGKDKDGNETIYQVLCLVLKPAYEAKVRTLELSAKQNPGAKTNYGKWVLFVKNSYAGSIPKGTVFGIYAENTGTFQGSPAISLSFTKTVGTETQQATGKTEVA